MRATSGRPGTSHVAVLKAITTGRLARSVVRGPTGAVLGIVPDLADQEWVVTTDPAKQRDLPAGGRPPRPEQGFFEPAPAPAAAPLPGQGGPSSAVTFARARAIKEGFLARMAELEYRERTGALVEADEVRREAARAGREVRDAVLNAAGRLGPELAPITDPRDLTDRLVRALSGVLKKVAETQAPPGAPAS